MKKIIVLISLVLCVMLMLTACFPFVRTRVTFNDSSQAPTEGVTQSSSTDSVPSTLTSDDYVAVAREQRYNYTDSSGNKYDFTFRIPQILLSSSDAEKVNAEILSEFTACFDEADNNMSKGYGQPCYYLDFEDYLCNGALSIVMRQDFEGGGQKYHVYCFDVTSGKQLSNTSLLSKLGYDYSDTMTALTEATKKEYESNFGAMASDSSRTSTMNSKNIESSPLYVDDYGSVYGIVTMYAEVGGGQFPRVVEIY